MFDFRGLCGGWGGGGGGGGGMISGACRVCVCVDFRCLYWMCWLFQVSIVGVLIVLLQVPVVDV